MNFLAHLHLSYPSAPLMTGNFLADNLKRADVIELPESVRKGILLHHQIDAYTDSHPIVKEAKRRLYPHHRKYAGVILDIWYDYLLMRHWEDLHGSSFHVFELDAYRLLQSQIDFLTGKAEIMVRRLLEFKWLGQYGTIEGMDHVFYRVSNKVSKPDLLKGVVERLKEDGEINGNFKEFYSELNQYVNDQVSALSLQN